MNYNELAKAAYENAKAKGFYDKPVSIPERMALIHSELSEALEADRKGRYCGGHGHPTGQNTTVHSLLGERVDKIFNWHYEALVKGTFEEEMADVVIRILDFAGSKNRPIGFPDEMWPLWYKAGTTPEKLAVLHFHVSSAVGAHYILGEYPDYLWNHLFAVLQGCKWICDAKGIDLELHVKAKMRYNSLRPHMHGGKKY